MNVEPNDPPTPIADGVDPPSYRLDRDYKIAPVKLRECVKCGKVHDLILEDTRSGERVTEFNVCKECFFNMPLEGLKI